MQKMLIPDNSHMPQILPSVVKWILFPALEVGGDYYDCIRLSDTKIGLALPMFRKRNFRCHPDAKFPGNTQGPPHRDIDLVFLVETSSKFGCRFKCAGEKFITFFFALNDSNNQKSWNI